MDHHLTAFTDDSAAAKAQTGIAYPATAATSPNHELPAGDAIRLRAAHRSVLRISHGQVWATLTFKNAHSAADMPSRAGDHFLARGDSLTLMAGEEVVLETYAIGYASSARYSWQSVQESALPTLAAATAARSDWQTGVAQPMKDLRHAGGLLMAAAGRLLQGLVCNAGGLITETASRFAILFIANRPDGTSAGGSFDSKNANKSGDCANRPAAGTRDAGAPMAVANLCKKPAAWRL